MKLRLPCLDDISALTQAVPVLAGVGLPTPVTVKRALAAVEPVVMFAAEAAGAGVPELILVVAVVRVAKHVLAQDVAAEKLASLPTWSRGADSAARPAA